MAQNGHLIEILTDPRGNVIRQLFLVSDTSSDGENCGLRSLGVDPDNFDQTRRDCGLPANGRLSGEELAKVAALQQCALLIVQVLFSDDMDVDADGNVLVEGYGLSLFEPSDDVCGIITLLNEQGHFSPVSKANGDLIFAEDIINTIASVDGSDYEDAQQIFSDFHEPAMLVDAKIKAILDLL